MRELDDGDEISEDEAEELLELMAAWPTKGDAREALAFAWEAGWLMCANGGKTHRNPFKNQ